MMKNVQRCLEHVTYFIYESDVGLLNNKLNFEFVCKSNFSNYFYLLRA